LLHHAEAEAAKLQLKLLLLKHLLLKHLLLKLQLLKLHQLLILLLLLLQLKLLQLKLVINLIVKAKKIEPSCKRGVVYFFGASCTIYCCAIGKQGDQQGKSV
jgi:hypothetical protein